MELLISFCNVTTLAGPTLGLLDLASFAFRPLQLPGALPRPLGITGLAATAEHLFAARQALVPTGSYELLVFDRSDLRLVSRHTFQIGRDVHSLWVSGDQLYAVSTGTDEVLRLELDGSQVRSEAVLWRPEPDLSRADHHHLNAVGEWRGDLLVSGFGKKAGQRWSQAREGFLFNISRGERLAADIHHPHSLAALEDTLAYCASAPMTVATLAGTRSRPLGGYPRGLCSVDGQLYVGTSVGRLVSRSTGQFANPGEPGLPAGRCAVLRLSVDLEVEQTVDLSAFGAEIYDLLPVEGTARWPIARPKAPVALPRTEQSTPVYSLNGFSADSPSGDAAQSQPSGGELASIIILCCNQLASTRLCLESVLAHTRPPYELILVDNGSTDATPAYLEALRSRPGPARVEVIRNETNRGFAAGCNQGLAAAQGRYLVLLNNDTVVPAGWLEGLLAWALHDWPKVGLVGPVSNYAAAPQQVAVNYTDLAGAHAFAARRARAYFRKALRVERLTGFCLLLRREVLERVGALDEGFGLGFFEDDDLCMRAREAGFGLLLALNVFVHHFGSRTFRGLGLDCQERLAENFARFRAKWGPERTAGYRLPAPPGGAPVAGPPRENAASAETSRPARADRPAGARPRVSLCMIVKNEEANLPDCLASAAGLFDEIIVVDTGSTDRTKEVAACAGAQVFDFPWVDSFAAARNESLKHATGDWAFWLDADDRLDADNRAKLQALFCGLPDEHAGYVMKCLCLPDPQTGTATVVDHVRLFRNDRRLRWKYRIHEQILPALRATDATVRWADVVIQHTGYLDPALRGRKLERDLRLLQLEDAEHPDDPFTLFNLGQACQELGRTAEAVTLFQRSLRRSQPTDSIVRKLFALLLQCHRQLGQHEEMLAACRAGLRLYPEDAELRFQEGLLLREAGDREGAKARFRQLLSTREKAHFASVAAGLQGYKARHNLAVICREQGQADEAEAHWRAAVAEQPGFTAGWAGLGELYLDQGRWAELEEVLARLRSHPRGALEAVVLQARVHLTRKEFTGARQLLEEAVRAHPKALAPRILLSHVLLQEGRDWDTAEQALRAVLALDPGHVETRHNLAVLLQQQGRAVDAAFAKESTLDELYQHACTNPSDIHEHLPTLVTLARECRHVTELGTRTAISTTALLYAQPDRLVCYDKVKYPQVDLLRRVRGRTEFVFHQADVLQVEIEETDLLFIDTWHVYEQLKEELRLHAAKVRRYIVLHDTSTYGEEGEAPGHQGLWPAVEEFLAEGRFRLQKRFRHNHGLTVLEAVPS